MAGALESDSQLSWKATDKLTLDSGWAAVWMPTTWSIRRMQELGADVEIVDLGDLDHTTASTPAYLAAAQWFETLR